MEESLDPASLSCLERTRSGVLNVLVVVGVFVALTGLLLRGRAAGAPWPLPPRLNDAMLLSLILIFVVSSLLRRVLGRRSRLRDPRLRGTRFYWGHLLPAAIGALAAPLGLVHGWLISARLEAILPFWVTALVLGVLAYPRGRELEGFDTPMDLPGVPLR
jgi:hypothetical protein